MPSSVPPPGNEDAGDTVLSVASRGESRECAKDVATVACHSDVFHPLTPIRGFVKGGNSDLEFQIIVGSDNSDGEHNWENVFADARLQTLLFFWVKYQVRIWACVLGE